MQRVNKYAFLHKPQSKSVVTINFIKIIKITKERKTIFKMTKRRRVNINKRVFHGHTLGKNPSNSDVMVNNEMLFIRVHPMECFLIWCSFLL